MNNRDVIYRMAFGDPPPVRETPLSEPTVQRIPQTEDGHTWHAYAISPEGRILGGLGHTEEQALEALSEQWAMFA